MRQAVEALDQRDRIGDHIGSRQALIDDAVDK